jgi:hypothetical protein
MDSRKEEDAVIVVFGECVGGNDDIERGGGVHGHRTV